MRIFRKLLTGKTVSTDNTLAYYRERIFYIITLTFLITGILALIPGIYASIKFENYTVAVLDGLAYLLLLFVFFVKNISIIFRKSMLLSLPYILGVVFMFKIGPGGPGFAYLVGFNILGAILIGYRTTVFTLSLTTLTLVLLTGVIHYNLFPGNPIHHYSTLGYFAAGINMILIGSVSSLPLAFLVKSLERKIFDQEKLQDVLKSNIKELDIAKQHAEESDRLKTAFLQNMSHEIRTPLNGILGFSELLDKNFNNKEKLKHYTSIITNKSHDLLTIINDILDIAKVESGQLTKTEQKCSLPDIFNELEIFFIEYQNRLMRNNIKLSFDLKFHKETTVIIDCGKLKQILINLIGNAFKFTHKGKITVVCKAEPNNNLNFCVSDTGIGISPDMQKKIFNRFEQATIEKNQLYGGNGLGLSIVKGFIDLLDGEISLVSEPGKGSTFCFTIPYKEAT